MERTLFCGSAAYLVTRRTILIIISALLVTNCILLDNCIASLTIAQQTSQQHGQVVSVHASCSTRWPGADRSIELTIMLRVCQRCHGRQSARVGSWTAKPTLAGALHIVIAHDAHHAQTIHAADASALCFDANEQHVLVGTTSGEVQLWSLQDQQRTHTWHPGHPLTCATVIRRFQSNNGPCTSIAYHPFGEFFCAGRSMCVVHSRVHQSTHHTGHSHGNVSLWDIQDTTPLQQFAGHAGHQVTRVHFSPDGRWVASACAAGHVKVRMCAACLHIYISTTRNTTAMGPDCWNAPPHVFRAHMSHHRCAGNY